MASTFERIGRKSLSKKNRLIKPKGGEITLIDEMMQVSPQNHDDAQNWANQFADLLGRNLLDRVSQKDIALILAGLVSYRNTGVTPQMSQMALMRGYESTSGLMQQVLHKILFSENIEKKEIIKSRFFGEISLLEIDAILSELNEQGYVVLPKVLHELLVDEMVGAAKEFNYVLRNPASEEYEIDGRKIDPLNPPQCVAAYAKSHDVATSQIFREFCNDPLLLHLASRHMGAKVYPIDSTLWYSFASYEPSADAAQLFHYDLDTLRWLKVFVYLTDVGPNSGPHEFVPSTHKPGTKPSQLLNKEYARLDDRDIDKYCVYDRREIRGERGTIILGDTRCLHKGNAVHCNYRLVFSPIYAPSKIGYFHGF